MLSGHTHGGQICLPGGIPILLEADLPRAFGAGAWRHADMAGYTSVGAGSSVGSVVCVVVHDYVSRACWSNGVSASCVERRLIQRGLAASDQRYVDLLDSYMSPGGLAHPEGPHRPG